ncbi:copper resistance protein B [Phenylobacterium sp. J367]|uniref:copper resistance protein B n=1 Tax=Phenylobacterium sp. J367 TaxID=2898435 RepID=UPI002150AD7D|nr:copper resistance protein B [Phenylobacterium sp. J367]MCR5879305.1 copper resistance protein B [Phenylobacterium sp. J367]
MRRLLILTAPLALATPALAQDPHAHHHAPAPAAQPTPDPHAGHQMPAQSPTADPHAGHRMPAAPADPHAGHQMPTAPADPHAGHRMPAAPADPHAGHQMPAAAADPHAGHRMPAAPADPHAGHQMPAQPAPADPHAGHQMPAAPADPHAGHRMPAADPHAGHSMAPAVVGSEPPPPPPTDHAAERFYSAAEMAAARAQLRLEHGDVRWSKVMLETFEVRPDDGPDVYAWEGEATFGGDINRFALTTEGEAASGELEHGEVQALYSRALDPYWNLQAGVRQDFGHGPDRTYATIGVEGVAPYWFEVEAAAFLSNKGDLSARLEGSYDLRLTQKLILEPRGEVSVAASADEAAGLGAGVQDIELGLRLRYAIRQTFAPYVGVHWERKLGDTADLARAHGEGVEDTRAVVGLRAWF